MEYSQESKTTLYPQSQISYLKPLAYAYFATLSIIRSILSILEGRDQFDTSIILSIDPEQSRMGRLNVFLVYVLKT